MNPANKVGADIHPRLLTSDGTDDPYRPDFGGRYVGRDGRSGYMFPGEREALREMHESLDRAYWGHS